jgi:uncharacterized DUF497 family protein
MTYFEWDETKREINPEKHEIDFIDAIEIFYDQDRIEFESTRSGEKRVQTIGMTYEVVIFLVYALRGKKEENHFS